MPLSESWFVCVIHSIKVTSGIGVSVSASVLVVQVFDSLPDLPRSCKLVLQPSFQAHGVCAEVLQGTSIASIKRERGPFANV